MQHFAKIFNGFPYHTKTRPLVCKANQWIGFYMIGKFADYFHTKKYDESTSMQNKSMDWFPYYREIR